MPNAQHALDITRVPILSLDANSALFFEGEMIVESLQRVGEDEEPGIEVLLERLEDNRARFEKLNIAGAHSLTGIEVVKTDDLLAKKEELPKIEDPTSTVNVQVDKSIDFGIVKRVLFTCEQAGYNRIRLAVGYDSSLPKKQEIEI